MSAAGGARRIGIGVLGGVVGGPASYGLRLAKALVEGGHAVTLFTDTPDRGPPGVSSVHVPMRGGIDRIRWQYLALGRALRDRPVDIFHDTKNALPLRRRQPCAVTVHDLAHVHCPETFGRGSRWFLGAATGHAVRRADAVIVPSEATARDVRAHWPAHAGKVHVVLHGIDPANRADPAECRALRDDLGFDGPFVLHVGTVQARKNLPLLCAAVARLRAAGSPVRLVAAGRLGWKAGPSEAALRETDGVHWLGAVSPERLRALYAEAAMFCSPSAYEGFGFTVADALAAGLPTIVSGISSLPEVVGDAGVVLPSLEIDALATAIRGVHEDPARAAQLGHAARRRAGEFTWQRAAEETAAVYSAIACGGSA